MKRNDEVEVTDQEEDIVHMPVGTIRTLLLMLPAIIALVGGGIAWGSTSARLNDAESEITELQEIVRGQESRLRAQENIEFRNEAIFSSIDESLLDIKQELQYLRENK